MSTADFVQYLLTALASGFSAGWVVGWLRKLPQAA